MKIFRNCIMAVTMLASALGFVSCGGSDGGDEPALDLQVTSATNSQQLTDGLYSSTLVTFVFSEQISLNSTSTITLDGTVISVTPQVSGNTMTMQFNFESESSHKISIGRYAVKSASGTFLSNTYEYAFTTEAKPVITNNFGELSNASATKEAKNVYNYLVQQNGKKILSGAMANVNNNNDFADWIYNITGKYPALTCYDFIHLPYSGQNWIDYSDITPAKTQWNNNGLVAYMWHWLTPSTEDDYDAKNYSAYSYNSTFDVNAALTAGTWQNECINKDIEKVAGYLKLLQDANIPVIWRPLHEAAGDYSNGAWFWWGKQGVEATKKLWIYLHDKLTKDYGLNNLIWVWTAQTTDGGTKASVDKIKAAYPGNDYVDIVGTDIYASNDESQVAIYQLLQQMTGGKKLITLSETGLVQNPDKCIADGADWSYFMIWYEQDKNGSLVLGFGNTAESLKTVFGSSYVINRSDMPSLK